MNENSKISTLKGIGEKTQALFEKAGMRTIGDLLRYYPRGYDVYDEPVPVGEAEEGRTVTITGAIFGRVQLGDYALRQGPDRHFKSDLVPDAFSKKYAVQGRDYHSARPCCQKKGWPGYGASRDLLSECKIRGKKKYPAAVVSADQRAYKQCGKKGRDAGYSVSGSEAGVSAGGHPHEVPSGGI